MSATSMRVWIGDKRPAKVAPSRPVDRHALPQLVGWIIEIEMPSFNQRGGHFPMRFPSTISHRGNSRETLQQLGIRYAAVRSHDLNRIRK
jgi:hypothetical protein